MSIRVISLFLVSCMVIMSCSSSGVFLEPAYTNKKINDGCLAVQIVDFDPNIFYEGNIEPEFGKGNTRDLIMAYFKKQLPVDILRCTTLKDVKVFTKNLMSPIEKKGVEVWLKQKVFSRKEIVSVRVPALGNELKFEGYKPEYVLIIEGISIGTVFEGTPGTTGFVHTPGTIGLNWQMQGGGIQKQLKYASTFALWSNKDKELISFGYIEKTSAGFFPFITMTNWHMVSYKYVRGIFNKSPFLKREGLLLD